MSEVKTSYENKLAILSELWFHYKDDQNFEDFFEYNDLGLPLAYLISAGIIESTDKASRFIEETFVLLLAALDIEEDAGFEDLDTILQAAGE